uniref:Scavenger receptor class B member 1 n=1 Tax=Neolamprologus brichardi TaxID=32507 RepID=A0A3Q4GPF7_NEOBR
MAIKRPKVAIGFIVAGVLMVLFGTIMCFVVPLVIDDQIVKHTVIDPKNDLTYTMWKDIPVPFFMSVYFFNVLNPAEILKGEKPMVEQRGPYVYRKQCQKENITFHPNGTVSYREYRQYHFEPSMSAGNESDVVTIPNMLVLGASVMMENLPYVLRLMMSATFKTFKEGPFLTKPVGELMWGYDSGLVDFLNKYLPGMIPTSGKFGLFSEVSIRNFKEQIFQQLQHWPLPYWRTAQSNMINGTAGQMWPPFMTKESTLPFYSPDACRSMELVYQRPGEMYGIPLYRYVAPKTLFANGTDYAPNEGFCPCRQSGLLNVSSCRHNLYIFVVYLQQTGVPLNVSIRLQLNLYMKKVSGITETGKISDVVMPMIWFEENGYIDGPIVNTFRTNLVVLPTLLEYLQYILIGLGLATIIVAAVVYHKVKVKLPHRIQASMLSSEEKDSLLQDDMN